MFLAKKSGLFKCREGTNIESDRSLSEFRALCEYIVQGAEGLCRGKGVAFAFFRLRNARQLNATPSQLCRDTPSV